MATASSSSTDMLHTVYLALGSNMGEKRQQMEQAIRLLQQQVGEVEAVSPLIETEPWGFASPHKFLNGCVRCLTSLSPREVLLATQHIEQQMGRQEKTKEQEYKDRIIDIDILLYDQLSIHQPDLCIPHPHMVERSFVIQPLSHICPQWEELLRAAKP